MRFLNRLRKGLFVSVSVRKYVLYAIGEILLVMIGILLALQVNNWNEKKSLDSRVREQLENLKLTIRDNVRTMDFHIQTNQNRYYLWNYLLHLRNLKLENEFDIPVPDSIPSGFFDNPAIVDRNKIANAFGLFCWAFEPPPWTNFAMTEMQNTGLFASIRDDQLKQQINRYFFMRDLQLALTLNWISDSREKMLEIMRDKYFMTCDDASSYEDASFVFAQDRQLETILRALIRKSAITYSDFLKGKDRADKLISAIDQYIIGH